MSEVRGASKSHGTSPRITGTNLGGVKNQLTPDVAPTKGVKLNSHRSALYLLTGVIKIASKSFMRSRNSIYTHFSKLGELNLFATMLYTVHLHAYTSFLFL